MKRNLPGAFTFILNGTTRLPKIFRNRKEGGIRMPDLVDLVIDGGIGGTESSTIVDCTNGETEIVRQGKGWLNEG